MADYTSSTIIPVADITIDVQESCVGHLGGFEEHSINPIQVFPNPSNSIFTLNLNGFDAERVVVYNLQGQILTNEKVTLQEYTLNLSTQTEGVLHLQSDRCERKNVLRKIGLDQVTKLLV